MKKAWTYFYNAFVMGGDTTSPTGFLFDETIKEKIDLGQGYYGYKLTSQKGTDIIVESESGAIVGNSVDEVAADICGAVLAGQENVMKQQVAEAMKANIHVISEEKFWATYDKRK